MDTMCLQYVRYSVRLVYHEAHEGNQQKLGSLTRPGLQQRPAACPACHGTGNLLWNNEMEEASDQPPSVILINPYFVVYTGRRRKLISGKPPPGHPAERPVTARDWQAYINRMSEEPPWERAWRYRLMLSQQGFKSIRALALAIREDHSRVARILQILKLPERVLAALRAHADHPRIRAHFTEKRLRQLVRQNRAEAAILLEIEQVAQSRT